MRMLIERHYIEDALDRAGLDPEDNFREDYSGRGMYGAKCIGIIGNTSDLLNFVVEMTRILETDTTTDPRITVLIENVCQDSMAFDSIYYWPGLGVKD